MWGGIIVRALIASVWPRLSHDKASVPPLFDGIIPDVGAPPGTSRSLDFVRFYYQWTVTCRVLTSPSSSLADAHEARSTVRACGSRWRTGRRWRAKIAPRLLSASRSQRSPVTGVRPAAGGSLDAPPRACRAWRNRLR
jgi:hypothetical protein